MAISSSPHPEADQRAGEKRAMLDLSSPDHFFRERLSSAGAFSSGGVPWNFVASLLVKVEQPLENGSVTAILETEERVYLTLVDAGYQALGERVTVPAGGPREMTLPLVTGAQALVIQAGAAPKGQAVTLHKAWLGTH